MTGTIFGVVQVLYVIIGVKFVVLLSMHFHLTLFTCFEVGWWLQSVGTDNQFNQRVLAGVLGGLKSTTSISSL